MRFTLILFFFLFYNQLLSQNWVDELRKSLPKSEARSSIQKFNPTKAYIDYYADSTMIIEKIIQSYFYESKTNDKIKLEQSSLLNYLSLESIRKISENKKVKKKPHYFKQKRLMRIIKYADINYNLLDYVTFELPLVYGSSEYFYDESNGDSPYHLYKGKRPTNEEIENGTAVFESCNIHTERSISRIIEQKLRTSPIGKLLRSMQVETFGIAIVPKTGTLHKRAIPKLKVFVIVGVKNVHFDKSDSKRMKRMKKHAMNEAVKQLEKFARKQQ